MVLLENRYLWNLLGQGEDLRDYVFGYDRAVDFSRIGEDYIALD